MTSASWADLSGFLFFLPSLDLLGFLGEEVPGFTAWFNDFTPLGKSFATGFLVHPLDCACEGFEPLVGGLDSFTFLAPRFSCAITERSLAFSCQSCVFDMLGRTLCQRGPGCFGLPFGKCDWPLGPTRAPTFVGGFRVAVI